MVVATEANPSMLCPRFSSSAVPRWLKCAFWWLRPSGIAHRHRRRSQGLVVSVLACRGRASFLQGRITYSPLLCAGRKGAVFRRCVQSWLRTRAERTLCREGAKPRFWCSSPGLKYGLKRKVWGPPLSRRRQQRQEDRGGWPCTPQWHASSVPAGQWAGSNDRH